MIRNFNSLLEKSTLPVPFSTDEISIQINSSSPNASAGFLFSALISQILDSVGNSFSTNMETKSINRFIKMQLNDMRGWSIESQNLVGTDLYTYTYTYPNLQLYVMKQDENSIAMSKNKINKYLKG